MTGTAEQVSGVIQGSTANLLGTGTSATVNGTGTISLDGSGQGLTLTNSGATLNVAAGETGENVNASGTTIVAGAGAGFNVAGNTNNITADGGMTGNIGGTGNTLNLVVNSASSIGLSGTVLVNGNGGNDILGLNGAGGNYTVGGNGTIEINAASVGLTLESAGADVGIAGGLSGQEDIFAGLDTINAFGKGTVILDGAGGTTLNLTANTGSGVGIDSANEIITGDSGTNAIGLNTANASAMVFGNGAAEFNAGGGSVTMETAGASVGIAGGLSGQESITATSGTIGAFGTANFTVGGALDQITLAGDTGSTLNVSGLNQSVFGNSGSGSAIDTVNLLAAAGTQTSATISGSGNVGIIDSNVTATLENAGATVTTVADLQSATINASSCKVDLGGAFDGSVVGSSNQIASAVNVTSLGVAGDDNKATLAAGSGVGFAGTGNQLTSDGDALDMSTGSQLNVFGDNNSCISNFGGLALGFDGSNNSAMLSTTGDTVGFAGGGESAVCQPGKSLLCDRCPGQYFRQQLYGQYRRRQFDPRLRRHR